MELSLFLFSQWMSYRSSGTAHSESGGSLNSPSADPKVGPQTSFENIAYDSGTEKLKILNFGTEESQS